MPSPAIAFASLILLSIALPHGIGGRAQRPPDRAPACRIAGEPARNRDLPEGSGIAASRRSSGVVWAHNDSAEAVLLKLDDRGSTTGRLRITGAEVDDWEDLAIGPCGDRSCLYIGDIGDNNGTRGYITVYRVPEPDGSATATPPAEAFRAMYPDGPHDAESLFVTADSSVFIVTKGSPGPIALYRFPRPLQAGATMRLDRIGQPLRTGDVPLDERPTGADASADGQWVVIRTHHEATFYRTRDLMAGRWQAASRTDLKRLGEPRGEGITFGPGGVLYLLGEGPANTGGTFGKLTCATQSD